MSDEISPQTLRNLLREQLQNREYWQDSMMQQFRKQFWEPMDADLNLVADEMISSTSTLEAVTGFFRSIQNF